MSDWKGIITGSVVVGSIIIFSSISSHSAQQERAESLNSYAQEKNVIDRQEAIDDHWDEVKAYLSGTETIEACSQSGCYDLDAEISNGEVEVIYFLNGGYLYFSADIYEDGSASDFDQNGNAWEFTVDMDSATVDDAISEWASDNEYVIE